MEILVVDDYKELSQVSANIIKELITKKHHAVLGLATGSTPIGMYQELIHYHKNEALDFSSVKTFNLDEYVGMSPEHPQSYNKFMYDELFNHINILRSNIHIPCGDVPDLEGECLRYEHKIADAGGIDIQVLGIGSNGHIGFNEPGSNPKDRTRVVRLAKSTIKANARFFGKEELVPRLAISMGIQTILDQSKKIMLLASGEGKSDAVCQMIKGGISDKVPASLLQLHNNVTVIADAQAAKKLK
jgi:glucosamine-6-phosphate deaminase